VLFALDVASAMTVNTIPESHRDLLESDVAVLATIGSDSRPQLSAVWFLADDDGIRLSLNTSRQKVRNLRANPATYSSSTVSHPLAIWKSGATPT